jgi:hypothetical protein
MADTAVQTTHAGLLSRYLYNLLGTESIGIKIFSIFLLLFQAIQINRLVSLNRLTSENSLFPGVFYILIISSSLEFIPLHPQLLANTFIIMMLLDVFKQTRNVQLHLDMFNVGLWIGLASLFYFPYVLFIIIGIIGVIYLRTYKWVDTLRALLGVLIPYFLLGTIIFVFNRLPDLWSLHMESTLAFLDLTSPLSWKDYVLIAVFGMIILTSLAMSSNYSSGMNIHVRKKMTVILISLIGSLVLMVVCAGVDITSLLFLSIPMSILMASLFLSLEPQFAEVLHFIIFMMALGFQYLV